MSQDQSVCPHPYCQPEFKRKPLGTSKDGYCIFHAKAEEKDKKQFNEALKTYIKEIKANDLDYAFEGFVFAGDINFDRDFGVALFENADFWRAEFQGDVHFFGAKFQGNAHFRGAKFQGNAYFGGAEFQEIAYFEGAEFRGNARFGGAEFRGNAHFRGAEFQGTATFLQAEFQGNADFRGAEFQEIAYFVEAEFRARASISPQFIKRRASFLDAILENISLTPLNLGRNALLDFTRARLRNTEIRRRDIEGHIIQERDKNFSAAKEVYLLLKNNFHSLGRYDDESWAFKKEKDMERKSYFHFRSFPKWLGSMFWNVLYGYGERLIFILGWCAGLIFFSSIWYWLYKGVGEVVGQHVVPLKGYLNYLYFSIVTFTTLGYGDYRPIGGIKALASIEALLGIFFIALFIFAFARRTAGR